MSIREFLGLVQKPAPAAEADAIEKVVDQLDHLEESQARYIAAFAFLLSRVAHADLSISGNETAAMERILTEHGLPPAQAQIVVQMSKSRAQLFGGTENFLVTREFTRTASPDQKMSLIECLFTVAASEGKISTTEDNEIRQVASEIHVEHPTFIAIRSRWRDQLAVLQGLPLREPNIIK